MAISTPVIPFGTPGGAAAAPLDAAAEEGGALPGGFLGMLAGLVPSAPTLTMPAVSDASMALLAVPVSDVADVTDVVDASSPEAAAAAMAVMAQMLAAPQSVASQTVALQPAAPEPVASSPVATSPPAPALQAQAPVAELTVLPGTADAATEAIDATGVAQKAAALPFAALMPRQVSAQPSPALALTDVPQDASAADETSAFQPLTAMLQLVSRSDGAAQPKLAALVSALNSASADSNANPTANPAAQASPAVVVAGDSALPDGPQQHLIRESVGTSQWADSIGARLTMMATRGEQHGALRLSPEHLGPVEVQIRMQDDKASVWFGAQHADTRAALQDALPRLRELFAAQGLQLGDAGVSREPPRQDAAPSRPSAAGSDGAGGRPVIEERNIALPASVIDRHAGLLDTYA